MARGGAGHRRQVRAAGAQVRQVRWQVRPVPGAGRGFASARLCRPPAGTCPLCRAVGLSYPSAKPLLGMAQGCEWPLGGLLSGGGWWALIPTCRSSSGAGQAHLHSAPLGSHLGALHLGDVWGGGRLEAVSGPRRSCAAPRLRTLTCQSLARFLTGTPFSKLKLRNEGSLLSPRFFVLLVP